MRGNIEKINEILGNSSVDEIRVPDEYICPITYEIMRDPVIAADGFSYEREAITTWLKGHASSPKTGEHLAHRALTANKNLRILVHEFIEKIPQLKQQDQIRQDLMEAIRLREEDIQKLISKKELTSSSSKSSGSVAVYDELGIESLLQGRALQKEALSNSYNEAITQQKTLLEQLNLKVQAVIAPLQETRDQLSRQAEVFSLQLQCLEEYKVADITEEKIAEWQEAYQKGVTELVQFFISDYKNHVDAREAVYRDAKLISIETKEEKLQEVAHFEEKFRREELPDYVNWVLPRTQIEAKENYSLKEAKRNAALAQYEELMQTQTNHVERFLAERENLAKPWHVLNLQSKSIMKNPDDDNIIYKLCRQNDITALKEQLSKHFNKKNYLARQAPRALHIACEANQLPMVRYLIEKIGLRQKQDLQGYYPLHAAATCTHVNSDIHSEVTQLLDYLLKKGANVECLGPYDRTPLHTAALYGSLPAVAWLVAQGADINRAEKGRFQANTPLHNAAFAGHVEIVDFLLQKGANPRLLNKTDATALMEAIEQGKLNVVEIFWKRGIWLLASERKQLLEKPLTKIAMRCLNVPLQPELANLSDDVDIFSKASVAASQQKGWNCFDVAVGIEREQVVTYALKNSADLEFRRLLAPEIRHAAAVTAVYMQMNKLSTEQSATSNIFSKRKSLLELFQIEDALAEKLEALQMQNSSVSKYALPNSMQNENIFELVNHYFDAHEAMKAAVAECNDVLGKNEGQRLSLEELDELFSIPDNIAQYQQAHASFFAARNQLFAPVEQKFKEYCESEDTYKTYVQDYYGACQWFAFQRQFADHQSTSMVDIVARMLDAKIMIHNNQADQAVLYETRAYGAKQIHITFNGRDHFESMVEADVIEKPIIFSNVYAAKAENASTGSTYIPRP